MLSKKLVIFTLFLSVTGCITQNSFQPARHDAEYWQKPNESYNFNTTLSDMKSCGWLRPKDNLDENGKIKMELYKNVDECMKQNGYVSRVPPNK